MAAVASFVNKNITRSIKNFLSCSHSYFKKRNPIMAAISGMLKELHAFLISGKRLKMLKYQSQLMRYRIHQMEKLIAESNSTHSFGGSNLNKLR